MASHRPSRVWTLFATATWVCRSGSPARESRWVNAAATRPRDVDLADPVGARPGEQGVLLDEASASATASWWARSIGAAIRGSAIAHRVDTDLTGEKVRSNPATAVVLGRECFAIVPASSRASIGSRPCSARKNSGATSVRIRARSAAGDRPVRRAARRPALSGRDPLGDLDPERR